MMSKCNTNGRYLREKGKLNIKCVAAFIQSKCDV